MAQTMTAYVDHICYALGDVIERVEDCAQRGGTISDTLLLKDAGFHQHHICAANDTAYNLAHNAVSQIAERVMLNGNIGAIIYSTCLPCNGNIGNAKHYHSTRDVKHLMDFPASHLQSDFSLNSAQVYGLNQQACTGMLGSIKLASLLVAAGEAEEILCVTADRFPEDAIYEQAYNLISDGAAACIVSGCQQSEEAFRLVAHHGITNGAMAYASDDETVGTFFNYSYAAITQLLTKANIAMQDIAWIVPQNTNKKAWQILASLLKFDYAKVFFPSLENVGHVISGDNMINLKHLQESGLLKPGDKVLLSMAGYGLNWQCLILEKC